MTFDRRLNNAERSLNRANVETMLLKREAEKAEDHQEALQFWAAAKAASDALGFLRAVRTIRAEKRAKAASVEAARDHMGILEAAQ